MFGREHVRRCGLVFALIGASLGACARTQIALLASEAGGTSAWGGVSPGGVGGAALGGVPPFAAVGGSASAMSIAGSSGGVLGVAATMDGGGVGGSAGSAAVRASCDPSQTPLLDGPLAIETKAAPVTSVVGDWNADGKLDLATGDSDGTVSVWFGTGGGTFGASVRYITGFEAMSPWHEPLIATGDVDGNGTFDLVLADRAFAALTVLLGAGDGTFAAAGTYPLEAGAIDVTLGDFTGDRVADVAVADDNGLLRILPALGNGTLGMAVVTALGDRPRSISAGDLNRDGRLDLVSLGDHETSAWLGHLDGSFARSQAFETGSYLAQVRVADFNGDGDADLAISQTCIPPGPSTGAILLLLGHGDGSFAEQVTTQSSTGCLDRILVADANADGLSDLVTSEVTVLLGNRAGATLPEVRSSKVMGGDLLATGDWNGDGKLDLATTSHGWLAVHLGANDGSFGTGNAYDSPGQAGYLALADLDSDGVPDVATATYQWWQTDNPNLLSVWRGAGDGTLLSQTDYPSAQFATRPAAADLDGDGWQDIVALAGTTNIAVFMGKGGGAFAPELDWATGSGAIAFAIGDVNGDRHPDVVVANDNPESLSLLFGIGDGTLAPAVSRSLPSRPGGIVLLDANEDTKLDIALVLHHTAAADHATVDILLGNGDGTFAPDRQYQTDGSFGIGISSADFDSDGKVDLLTWNADFISVLLGAGDGSFTARLNGPGNATQVSPGDIDQDGHPDLALTDAWGFTIRFGVGDGTFACARRYSLGKDQNDIAIADLNHDGRIDIATTSHNGVNVFLNARP